MNSPTALDRTDNMVYNCTMIRTNHYFPQQMLDALKAASEKHGLPVSEIIRRAITEWLKCN